VTAHQAHRPGVKGERERISGRRGVGPVLVVPSAAGKGSPARLRAGGVAKNLVYNSS